MLSPPSPPPSYVSVGIGAAGTAARYPISGSGMPGARLSPTPVRSLGTVGPSPVPPSPSDALHKVLGSDAGPRRPYADARRTHCRPDASRAWSDALVSGPDAAKKFEGKGKRGRGEGEERERGGKDGRARNRASQGGCPRRSDGPTPQKSWDDAPTPGADRLRRYSDGVGSFGEGL